MKLLTRKEHSGAEAWTQARCRLFNLRGSGSLNTVFPTTAICYKQLRSGGAVDGDSPPFTLQSQIGLDTPPTHTHFRCTSGVKSIND